MKGLFCENRSIKNSAAPLSTEEIPISLVTPFEPFPVHSAASYSVFMFLFFHCSKYFFLFLTMYVHACCLCGYTRKCSTHGPKRGWQIPWSWSNGQIWTAWTGCLKSNYGPLQEQHVFLNIEPSLQPSLLFFLNSFIYYTFPLAFPSHQFPSLF